MPTNVEHSYPNPEQILVGNLCRQIDQRTANAPPLSLSICAYFGDNTWVGLQTLPDPEHPLLRSVVVCRNIGEMIGFADLDPDTKVAATKVSIRGEKGSEQIAIQRGGVNIQSLVEGSGFTWDTRPESRPDFEEPNAGNTSTLPEISALIGRLNEDTRVVTKEPYFRTKEETDNDREVAESFQQLVREALQPEGSKLSKFYRRIRPRKVVSLDYEKGYIFIQARRNQIEKGGETLEVVVVEENDLIDMRTTFSLYLPSDYPLVRKNVREQEKNSLRGLPVQPQRIDFSQRNYDPNPLATHERSRVLLPGSSSLRKVRVTIAAMGELTDLIARAHVPSYGFSE